MMIMNNNELATEHNKKTITNKKTAKNANKIKTKQCTKQLLQKRREGSVAEWYGLPDVLNIVEY